MTTDLGVECMVGLCLAAAIWWIARRRRTHTEGPKTRLDPLGLAELEPLSTTDDKTKDDLLVEDNSMQGNASGVPGKALLLESSPSSQPQQQEEQRQADDMDNEPDQEGEEDKDESWDVEDEDDAAEPDLTDDEDEEDEAGDDEEEEHEEEEDEDKDDEDEPRVVSAEIEAVPLETLAKVEALAAKMGVNMTESFMAMEEFLVLDAPPSAGHVLPSFEADRMRLEDPAVVVPLSDTASESPNEEGEETDDNNNFNEEEEEEEGEEVRERRESQDDNEQQQEDAPAPDQAEAASFWAKCENKEECNLCHTPFTFLTRRHHCRKCFASVCGACSANSAPLPEFGDRLERVCDTCWASLQQQKQQDEHKAS